MRKKKQNNIQCFQRYCANLAYNAGRVVGTGVQCVNDNVRRFTRTIQEAKDVVVE